MFLRRKKRTVSENMRETMWPRMGFKRMAYYYRHRLGRMAGTPHFIALGFAFGVGVSFTPLIGLHVALTVALCYMFRGSIISGILGTFVGNPWTAVPIWLSTYESGRYILYARTGEMLADKDAVHFQISLKSLMENAEYYFLPMMVGSVPMGILWGGIFYALIYRLVRGYQMRRRTRIAQRRQQLQAEMAHAMAEVLAPATSENESVSADNVRKAAGDAQ